MNELRICFIDLFEAQNCKQMPAYFNLNLFFMFAANERDFISTEELIYLGVRANLVDQEIGSAQLNGG